MKINVNNQSAVEAALAAVNGKATTHVYTTQADILAVAQWAEAELARLIGKSFASGAVVESTSGDTVANAYKYARSATKIRLERGASGWFLTHVAGVAIYAPGGSTTLVLTEAQDARAIEVLRKGYKVTKTATAAAA